MLHYFSEERDTGSISVRDRSLFGQIVSFGDIELDRRYAVSRETAADCIDLFARSGSRPGNILWDEL